MEFKKSLSTWLLYIEKTIKKLKCLKLDEYDRSTLNKKEKYYIRIIGQLCVYKIHTYDVVLCTEKYIFVETVTNDEHMWNKMNTSFYQKLCTHLLSMALKLLFSSRS